MTVITDGLGVCQPCVYPCLTCTITVNQCLSCSQEISALYLSGNTCVASSACPSTAYPDSATFKCVSCAAPCNKCTSAANCLNCDVGYILNSITHLCDSTCAVGTIPLVVDGANTCIACTLPCLTCVTTVTKCLSCSQVSSALYLSNNVCVADVNCPATTYPNSTSLHCEPCVAPCNTCTSYLHCLTCNTGFNFISSNFTCSDSCAIGTIPLTTSEGRICTACTFPCLTCVTTLTNCLSCSQLPTALYLSNGVCVPKCPASIFSNTDLMHC